MTTMPQTGKDLGRQPESPATGVQPVVPDTPSPAPAGQTEASSEVTPEPAQPVKQPRLVPDGTDVPSRGFKKFVFWLWLHGIGAADKPPRLGRREREQLERLRADQRRAFLQERIKMLTGPRAIVFNGQVLAWRGLVGKFAFNNVKSSGKSTTALNLASLLATLSCQPVLVLPATVNPGDGAMRSGVSPKDTLTLNQLLDMLPALKEGRITSSELRRMIQHNEYGVYVVAADFRDEPDAVLEQEYRELIAELVKHFQFIFMDGGNHLNGPEMGAVRVADQIVFTAFTGTVSTKYMLGKTMDRYAMDRTLREQQVVERAIVCVTGLNEDETVDEYVPYATYTFAGEGNATSQRRFSGSVLGVRFDTAISENMVSRLEALAPGTVLDYLELLYQLLLDSAARQGVDLSILERILEAEARAATNIPFVEDLADASSAVPNPTPSRPRRGPES